MDIRINDKRYTWKYAFQELKNEYNNIISMNKDQFVNYFINDKKKKKFGDYEDIILDEELIAHYREMAVRKYNFVKQDTNENKERNYIYNQLYELFKKNLLKEAVFDEKECVYGKNDYKNTSSNYSEQLSNYSRKIMFQIWNPNIRKIINNLDSGYDKEKVGRFESFTKQLGSLFNLNNTFKNRLDQYIDEKIDTYKAHNIVNNGNIIYVINRTMLELNELNNRVKTYDSDYDKYLYISDSDVIFNVFKNEINEVKKICNINSNSILYGDIVQMANEIRYYKYKSGIDLMVYTNNDNDTKKLLYNKITTKSDEEFNKIYRKRMILDYYYFIAILYNGASYYIDKLFDISVENRFNILFNYNSPHIFTLLCQLNKNYPDLPKDSIKIIIPNISKNDIYELNKHSIHQTIERSTLIDNYELILLNIYLYNKLFIKNSTLIIDNVSNISNDLSIIVNFMETGYGQINEKFYVYNWDKTLEENEKEFMDNYYYDGELYKFKTVYDKLLLVDNKYSNLENGNNCVILLASPGSGKSIYFNTHKELNSYFNYVIDSEMFDLNEYKETKQKILNSYDEVFESIRRIAGVNAEIIINTINYYYIHNNVFSAYYYISTLIFVKLLHKNIHKNILIEETGSKEKRLNYILNLMKKYNKNIKIAFIEIDEFKQMYNVLLRSFSEDRYLKTKIIRDKRKITKRAYNNLKRDYDTEIVS
jgi:hypothetical protein